MLLLRGATICIYFHSIKRIVSIHAPLARSNSVFIFSFHLQGVSIHAPLARSNLVLALEEWNDDDVSIHAPLARSNGISLPPEVVLSFNTCSSCEEQQAPTATVTASGTFQYMLLLRGATDRPRYRRGCWSFNTCSSCEEQMDRFCLFVDRDGVSIHAPLARSKHCPACTRSRRSVSIHAPLARSKRAWGCRFCG